VIALDITKMQKGQLYAVFTLATSGFWRWRLWFSCHAGFAAAANPLARLVRSARAVAGGQLDASIHVPEAMKSANWRWRLTKWSRISSRATTSE
jgi:hypothetical protein